MMADDGFRALFEQAPFSIQLLSPDGRTLAVNQAWREIWQIPEDVIQNYVLKTYNILEDPQLERIGGIPEIKKALAGGIGRIPTAPYDPKDIGLPGRRRVLGATVFPLRGADGVVQMLVLVHRDVTAEVESAERLEDALDTGRMALWELDLASNEVTRSTHHDRLYGYGERLPGWSFEQFLAHLHPDDRGRVQEEFAAMFREGRDTYAGDFRVVWPDGRVHWLTSRARFVPDIHGKPEKLRGMLADVTPLQEAIRARDEFLSLASHELRTPLTSLKLQTERLRRLLTKPDPEVPLDRMRTLVQQQARQIDRLARLVDDLLDISRLSTGRLQVEPEDADLAALLDDVLERIEPQLADAGCALSTRIERPVTGAWDRFRLEQVVVNLLANAARYGQGSPVEVTLEADPTHARLKVRDHGPGIAPEHHARIFERFERATSHDQAGLGLGLYIAREIVVRHGGTIAVESTPGQGATFVVTLPRRPGKKADS